MSDGKGGSGTNGTRKQESKTGPEANTKGMSPDEAMVVRKGTGCMIVRP
ncbi:hypothetical protein CGRA01v4_10223 [Colletotrichum graminicola]|nr:hypothetical protein CGRA01v4_10223 [Colletotrichum graminicola]